MTTKPTPFDRQNLVSLAAMLAQTAISLKDMVNGEKPNPNALAKQLRSCKLLVSLADVEVKELRNKK